MARPTETISHPKTTMGRISDAKERLMKAMAELIWVGSYGTTTIDQICEKAGVKKGSFYYFFESKSDLAVAAVDHEWQQHRTRLDSIFSPTVPPLRRLLNLCEQDYADQWQLKEKHGYVLGCPMLTLGAEVCTLEPNLKAKIESIMDQMCRYLETAVRDAHAAGLIDAPDAARKARLLFSYAEGVLARARIRNDLEILREMPDGILEILGATRAEPVAV